LRGGGPRRWWKGRGSVINLLAIYINLIYNNSVKINL